MNKNIVVIYVVLNKILYLHYLITKKIDMELNVIKSILVDNRRIVSEIEYVERDVIFDENINYVFVGLRQSGKSYLMFQRIDQLLKSGHTLDEILYLNLDDERLLGLKAEELDLILQAHYQLSSVKPIIFLDEIQNIEHWENFARRLANEKYRVYITGSNAKMLSSEIATTLGGRYIIQEVYPYSFKEYLKAKNIILKKNWEFDSKIVSTLIREFNDYFYNGGFPESLNISQKRGWLSSLYQKVFFGDLIARYKIRNDFALKMLIKKISESIKQPTSFTRLANIVSTTGKKIHTASVIEYVGYMEETWLLFSLANYAAKFAERESAKKYYFRDNGILNLFLISPETSLLENRVAIELKKMYGEDIYFFNKSIEVDFYIPSKEALIQVSYSISDEETRKREVLSLLKAAKYLKVNNLTIITYEQEDIINTQGYVINVVPLWKWLLINENN